MTSSNRGKILSILAKNGQYLKQNYVLKQAIYQKLKTTSELANFKCFRMHQSKLSLSILLMEQFQFELWYLKEERTSENM